jgi:hypothetical protein
MTRHHPDWPPICLDLVKVLLAGEVCRDDIETARRFMRDLVDHPELLAIAHRHEAAAIERLPKADRVGAMARLTAHQAPTAVRPARQGALL